MSSTLEWVEVVGPLVVSWPAVVLIVLFLGRRTFQRLINGVIPPGFQLPAMLESAKVPGGWEFKFRKEVEQLAKSPIADRAAFNDVGPEAAEVRGTYLLQATESPALAIVEAWRLVEDQLITMAKERGFTFAPAVWTMPLLLAAFLFQRDVIDEQQYLLLKRLKALRDSIIESPGARPSIADARTVIDLAFRFVASARTR